MSSDYRYQQHPRTVIPVTVNPSDDQRFIRFRSSDAPANGVHDRMSARMREFEEECRHWRDKFFNESRLDTSVFPSSSPSSSLMHTKPRMRMDFPDFPEFGSIDWPSFRGAAPGLGLPPVAATTSAAQRAFIEEDNDGRKKYKIQFDIGEFRPEELNVKVEGRMLVVKGDRQVKVGNATESKQFNRELTIPEFVDIKTLQSYLGDDGMLTMEAPVLMDRVYQDGGSSALTSGTTYRQASPGRVLDTTFTGGRPLSSSNYGLNNNQGNSYSSTSSSSSFRQDGGAAPLTTTTTGGLGSGGSSFLRNSPIRDQYSSTSSASTLLGGPNYTTPAAATFSTMASPRPDYSTNEGAKQVTYKFDLNSFAPEDIAIQVNDTMLKVSALRQDRSGNSSSHREFKREIGLPDGADAKNLTNTLSADGMLTIQIPVRDYRPPLTPTYQSQQFHLPSKMGNNNNNNMNDPYAVGGAGGGVGVSGGDQQLKLTFDLSGYKPEDVNVKVNNNVLKVQAVHNEETRGNQINREYMREYVLPDWVDVDHLRAKMSEDATLTVEVPIPHDRVPAFNRQIKITH